MDVPTSKSHVDKGLNVPDLIVEQWDWCRRGPWRGPELPPICGRSVFFRMLSVVKWVPETFDALHSWF